jgi:hypothetical protein
VTESLGLAKCRDRVAFSPVTLAVGQSTTEMIALTPDASTPLTCTLDATITATFGPSASPVTQTVQIPVNVVVPGAAAIANASVAAGQLGNTNLANQLSDLSTALTNVVENPASAVYQSQASLTAVVGLVGADPYLTITSNSTTQLDACTFTVTVSAEGATKITQDAMASFAARPNFVQIVSVTPSPAFTDPGGQVGVSAEILNAV